MRRGINPGDIRVLSLVDGVVYVCGDGLRSCDGTLSFSGGSYVMYDPRTMSDRRSDKKAKIRNKCLSKFFFRLNLEPDFFFSFQIHGAVPSRATKIPCLPHSNT